MKALTTAQEAQMAPFSAEALKLLTGGETSLNREALEGLLDFIYGGKGRGPEYVIARSPKEAFGIAESLGCVETALDPVGIGYDLGWITYYRFFQDVVGRVYKDVPFREFDTLLRASGMFGCLLFEGGAIIVQRPSKLSLDDTYRLHCSDAPAVEWADGLKQYFWHGTQAPQKLIETPEAVTKEDLANETNSEVSRAYAEKLGWGRYMEVAEAYLVDKHFDTSTTCHYELWDFKKREELTPRLLKMESPEVKDGTRPTYVEPVDPGLKTCQAARKWQFAKLDGAWPSVAECNDDPSLAFEWEA